MRRSGQSPKGRTTIKKGDMSGAENQTFGF